MRDLREKICIWTLIAAILLPLFAEPLHAARAAKAQAAAPQDSTVYLDAEALVRVPGAEVAADSIAPGEEVPLTVVTADDYPYGLDGKRVFNPDPTRAVWMSALFPCMGQIYNRRYWKLPIIVAGFMGLGYGTSWNSRMYSDYRLAYADIMDDDPNTKSYMDFFPPTVTEDSLDKSWLEQTLRSRRDYYRRNRELCIICCVGLYLLCMLDAYVDAHLMHYDISEDISMEVAPSMMFSPGVRRPTAALHWTLTF